MRRALLLIAAIGALLCAVPDARARDGGHYTREVVIDYPPVDSADILLSTRVNDSILFASPLFYYDGPWTNITVHFVSAIKDTATQTGLCSDTATFKLQTKVEDDSITYWKTIGATTKHALAAWDSTGTAQARIMNVGADGDGIGFITGFGQTGASATNIIAGYGGPYRGIGTLAINVSDADSAATRGTEFRILTLYNAAPDSISSHCILRSSNYIDILTQLKAIVQFHLR
jgi:hypothetical protein